MTDVSQVSDAATVTDLTTVDLEAAWSTIIGQAEAVSILRSWSVDPVHAYLFVGPSGSGKRQAARAFSAVVQALHSKGDDQARERQLTLALADKHADVEVHEPAGRQLDVDTARGTIIPSVFRKPIEGGRRIIVIDRFHDANPAAAAALLKTVEEPPPSAMIILLTESIPPEHVAIASRCARVEFPALSADALAAWLAEQGMHSDQASTMIEASGGDVQRLQLLADDPGFADRAELWGRLPATLDGSGATAGAMVRELMGLIDEAAEPLKQRHAGELEELDKREEMLGTRGSGRTSVDARHKRELRRLRTDELQFGLRVLAQRYGRELADGGGPNLIDAVGRLRDANEALIRNPNETLLLHNLFWNLPTL